MAVTTTGDAASLWRPAVARQSIAASCCSAPPLPLQVLTRLQTQVFWCRHCHNVAKDKEEMVGASCSRGVLITTPARSTTCSACVQDEKKRHELVRKDVREVICAICETRQPVAAACRHCHTAFGQYVCLACSFFEDDTSKGASYAAASAVWSPAM